MTIRSSKGWWSLIGQNFNYVGSDGNYHVGDTSWHSDRSISGFRFVKVAFYLDSLRADSGAIRVIPGSHNPDDGYAAQLHENIRGGGSDGAQTASTC